MGEYTLRPLYVSRAWLRQQTLLQVSEGLFIHVLSSSDDAKLPMTTFVANMIGSSSLEPYVLLGADADF